MYSVIMDVNGEELRSKTVEESYSAPPNIGNYATKNNFKHFLELLQESTVDFNHATVYTYLSTKCLFCTYVYDMIIVNNLKLGWYSIIVV